MATCTVCGGGFAAKRADANLCSPKCRKTASRARARAAIKRNASSPGNSSFVTDKPDLVPRMDGCPFALRRDTIPGRQWRVADGCRLQCDGMGGWRDVCIAADHAELTRCLAWVAGADVSAA